MGSLTPTAIDASNSLFNHIRVILRGAMPSKKKESEAPPELVALYDKMVASCPEAERKGASIPYTSENGHMYSFIHASGHVALRLPPGEKETFMEKYRTKFFDAYGMVQKDFVVVPEPLLRNADELAPYFAMSFAHCKTLKPKNKKKA